MHDDELHAFKSSIHLTQYAIERYGYRFVRQESSLGSHVLVQPATNDKIIVRRDVDGHWTFFSVRDGNDNGTIIEFERARGHHRSIGEVRRDLRRWLGLPARLFPIAPPRPAAAPDLAALASLFEAAAVVPTSGYLESRALTRATLSDPRFAGTWRLGPRSNVLFAHRDDEGTLTGFEIKNRGFTGFATGGIKAAWQSNKRPGDRELVITESAIDALSYHALFPEDAAARRYLSTAGAPGTRQLAIIDRLFGAMPQGSAIVAAADRDLGGEELAAKIARLALAHDHLSFRRHAPDLDKDWNDQLQREARERPGQRDLDLGR